MSGSIIIIKPQLGTTKGNLSNLKLNLTVGVMVSSSPAMNHTLEKDAGTAGEMTINQ
jgi:hypothetical protein